MDQDHFWLSEAQFARLEPHLPTDTRGKPRVDDRRVISGIVHVLISGGRWRDAPAVYGPRKTLYNRFRRWAAKDIWSNICYALAATGGPPAALHVEDGLLFERPTLHHATRSVAPEGWSVQVQPLDLIDAGFCGPTVMRRFQGPLAGAPVVPDREDELVAPFA
jgi:transposase